VLKLRHKINKLGMYFGVHTTIRYCYVLFSCLSILQDFKNTKTYVQQKSSSFLDTTLLTTIYNAYTPLQVANSH